MNKSQSKDRACKKCGGYIPLRIEIDGKVRNLKNRKFCLVCSPFGKHNTRDITKPQVPCGLQDRACKKCGEYIPISTKVDGKRRNLQNRKFCLVCSAFGEHNTRDITKPRFKRVKRTTGAAAVAKYRKRLKQRLISYKGGKCEICGYDKDVPRVYHFHHLNAEEKSFGISANLSLSFDKLKAETDKCQLLCCRCHYELHHEAEQLKLLTD